MHHPIIQLAAVAMRDGEQVGQFEAKLQFNPGHCDTKALAINRFAAQDWELAEEPPIVCQKFAKFLEPFKTIEKISKAGKPYKVACLAGYNAAIFDAPRLQKLFSDHQIFLPADYKVLDVFQLALWFFEVNPEGKPESLKLSSVCNYFGVKLENAHDALADCIATAQLTEKLLCRS